jgi:site-specific DNA-methyltransferase (adenine-specific)
MRKHDTIFWYSVGDTWTFNADAVRIPHSAKTRANYKGGLAGSGFGGDEDDRLDEKGKIPEDWWQMAIAARGKEYMGYPTQKPLALLERIILAASNPGDVVLDPFCGCGTALVAAEKLSRQWIGIDVTYLAIMTMRQRLRDACGLEEVHVAGAPTEVEGARMLANENGLDGRYQFQWWALDLIGATPVGDEKRKGADGGVDGMMNLIDGDGKPRQVVISVKSGGAGVSAIRDLDAVVRAKGATAGILITLEDVTRPMRDHAAQAGTWRSESYQRDYPVLQILTIEELLKGGRADLPPSVVSPFTRSARQIAPADQLRTFDQ